MGETWQATWLKAQLLLFGASIMAVCTAALLSAFG
jgi:hypothetical protein